MAVLGHMEKSKKKIIQKNLFYYKIEKKERERKKGKHFFDFIFKYNKFFFQSFKYYFDDNKFCYGSSRSP